MSTEEAKVEGASKPRPGAGRLAAEHFDLNLRLVETRERMAAICADRFSHPQVTARARHSQQRPIDPLEDQRNRRLLLDHLDMCQAIGSSPPWRVIEIALRLFRQPLVNPVAAITATEIEAIADPAEVRRLLDESGEYLARVLGSRQWKWLQGVRDVFGRRW